MDGYQEALKLLPPEIVGVFRAYHGQAEELRKRRMYTTAAASLRLLTCR